MRVLTARCDGRISKATKNKNKSGSHMGHSSFHRPAGGFDFIALRHRGGAVEIVYDDGAAHRRVWRVQKGANEQHLSAALAHAGRQVKVVPALYAELRKRSIAIEAVAG